MTISVVGNVYHAVSPSEGRHLLSYSESIRRQSQRRELNFGLLLIYANTGHERLRSLQESRGY